MPHHVPDISAPEKNRREIQARELAGLIYQAAVADEIFFAEKLSRVYEFLNKDLQKNHPGFITEIYPVNHNNSFFSDTLFLPFEYEKGAPNDEDAKKRKEFAGKKALPLFCCVFEFARQAAESGKLDKQALEQCLATPNNAGFTLLHEAAYSGDLSVAESVFRKVGEIVPAQCDAPYLGVTRKHGLNLLHEAVCTGNLEIMRIVFNAVRNHMPGEMYCRLLESHTLDLDNLFHCAAKTPGINSEGIDFLRDEFQQNIPNKNMRSNPERVINRLLGEKNRRGHTPFNGNARWVERLRYPEQTRDTESSTGYEM